MAGKQGLGLTEHFIDIQGTESRLQADFRAVQSERARLQSLIDGYTNVNVESDRTRNEERAKLEAKVDELQKEM